MIGDSETKEHFKFLSKHGIRAIGALFISNEKLLNWLIESTPEHVLTGFHLKDIFDSTKSQA